MRTIKLPRFALTLALGLAALGCKSKEIPAGWKDVASTADIDEVVTAGSDDEHLVVVYEADIDKVRAAWRKTAEASGFTLAYECKYDDGRLADGYLDKPKAVEYTLMPDDGDGVMVMASRNGNTEAFASVPDPDKCTMAQ